MSRNYVYTELTNAIEQAMLVGGLESESTQISHFIAEHGERFHFDPEKERYFINSFYPSFPGKAWERFVQGGYKMVSQNTRIPIQADIVVTGRCHCHCWHCFRIKDQKTDLTLREIHGIMSDLYDMGTATVGITGGEPMLRDDICDIIKLIPDGIEGQLYTTGHKITLDFAKFLSNTHITRVIISLDHYQENTANSMRNYSNAFAEAENAIRCLVKAGVYTAVTVCITERLLNRSALKCYFDHVCKLSPDEIRVILPIPQGNLEGKSVTRLYSQAIDFIKDIKREFATKKNYPGVVNFCEFESASYMGCSAGANYISINNDGLVTPCVAVPLSFGNIRENSLKKIFKDMERYFPKSGRVCYGKTSGRVMTRSKVDTTITPLNPEVSKKIASMCTASSHRAALFDCFCKGI